MFFTVYKTTNLITGRIYIGKHKCLCLDDNYLGSGLILKRAIKKYGAKNFKREILYIFYTAQEMDKKERELIDALLGEKTSIYNIKRGGQGGFDHIGDRRYGGPAKWSAGGHKTGPVNGKVIRERMVSDLEFRKKQICHLKTIGLLGSGKAKALWSSGHLCGRPHSQTSISKMKVAFEKIGHAKGPKNSQHGTIWINRDGINKKIKAGEKGVYEEDGWHKGRIFLQNKALTKGEQHPLHGTVYIHKERQVKRIKKIDLAVFLSNGWLLGRNIKAN